MSVQAPPAGPGVDTVEPALVTARFQPSEIPAAEPRPPTGTSVAEPARAGHRPVRRHLEGTVAGVLAIAAVAVWPVIEAVRILVGRGAVPVSGPSALADLGARRAWHLDQLVGPATRYGFHDAGPSLFYLLAPFVRLLEPSPRGVYLGAIVINGAALSVAVAVAWRRFGAPTALWVAAAIDLWCLCLGVGTLRNPAGTAMVVAPVVTVVVLWSAAISGMRGAYVWTAVIASFELQTHLATAGFCVGMLIVGAGAAMFAAGGDGRLRLPFRWWRSPARSVGLLALALIWLAPVVELFRDRPNNARLVWDFVTSHPGVGVHPALRAAADAITILPLGQLDPAATASRSTPGLVLVGAGLALLAVTTLWFAYQRRSRAAYSFVAAALVGGVIGVFSLTRAVGQPGPAVTQWLAYIPLSLLIGLGAALLGPLGPERSGPGFTAGLKAPLKWVRKHLPKRARRRPTGAARRARGAEARGGKGGKKAAGKLTGKATAAGGAAIGRRSVIPAPSWVGPSPWIVAVIAVAAVVAATATVRSDLSTAPVRTTALRHEAVMMRFAAAVDTVLQPSDRRVGFTLETPGAWVPVAGVIAELDSRGIQATVAPSSWGVYFGHERAGGGPVDVRFGVYPQRDDVRLQRAGGRIIARTPAWVLIVRPRR